MSIRINILGGGLGTTVYTAQVAVGGGVGTPATHWRIVELGHSSEAAMESSLADLYIAEIEMLASAGGTNLCVGGSVTTYGGTWTTPTNAFDGSVSTLTRLDDNTLNLNSFTGAIGYIFPTSVNVGALRLQSAHVTANAQKMPRGLVLQYSTDSGSTWISKEPIGPLADWGVSEQRVFEVSVLTTVSAATARLWRVFVYDYQDSGTDTYVGEVYWRTSSGGTNLASVSTGVPFGLCNAVLNSLRTMYDGNGSSWLNVGTSVAHGFFFETAPNPTHVGFYNWFSREPSTFNVQWSSDGVNWTTKTAFVDVSLTGLTTEYTL